MKQGLSLHIGVNKTDRSAYGEGRKLHGCVNDAIAMCDVASRNGFEPLAMLTNEFATFHLVEGYMRLAARLLGEGDTFMMTFSGHGAKIPTGDPDEDVYDEGLVLRDLTMKDNYIYVLLRLFRPRCRVILVADSCYSATIYRMGSTAEPAPEADAASEREDREHRGQRRLFASAAERHHVMNIETYRELDARFARDHMDPRLPPDIVADIVVLSACQDNEVAHDGGRHGVFTEALLCLLGNDRKSFAGSYRHLAQEIHFNVANEQRPSAMLLGPNVDRLSFQFFQGPVFSL